MTVLTSGMRFRYTHSKYLYFLSFFLTCQPFFLGVVYWASSSLCPPSIMACTSLENTKPLMGLRICHCKMWHLGMLNILSWKSLRKKQRHLSPYPSSPKTGDKFLCERYPYTSKKGDIIITRDRKFRAENTQILVVPFSTTVAKPLFVSILHKFVSLSKRYKSFLPWLLL